MYFGEIRITFRRLRVKKPKYNKLVSWGVRSYVLGRTQAENRCPAASIKAVANSGHKAWRVILCDVTSPPQGMLLVTCFNSKGFTVKTLGQSPNPHSLVNKAGENFTESAFYSAALAWRVTWQPTLTATGRPAICVGYCSIASVRQVTSPPKPCGPMCKALTASNIFCSSSA